MHKNKFIQIIAAITVSISMVTPALAQFKKTAVQPNIKIKGVPAAGNTHPDEPKKKKNRHAPKLTVTACQPPSVCYIGSPIIISGQNFSQNAEVWVGSIKLPLKSIANDQIVAKMHFISQLH